MTTDSDHMKPRLGYWHLWTDDRGVSHQTHCELTHFEQGRVGDAAPQWNDKQPRSDATVVFTALPVGWVGEWHETPVPQWIVPLSGRWFVEAMDGTRREFGAGELSLGEDQHCTKDAEGRTGHRSGTLGDDPCVLMCVQLHRSPAGGIHHTA